MSDRNRTPEEYIQHRKNTYNAMQEIIISAQKKQKSMPL